MDGLALTYQTYKLAFTAGLLTDVYGGGVPSQTSVDLAALRSEGGYVLRDDLQGSRLFPLSDPEGYWWMPSGQPIYSPVPPNPR